MFRILRSNVDRFPQSLLAKMVDDFPDLLESGELLYIDRNPRGFEWILEIYRKGDYRSSIPQMSPESLQNELDFYQLPSAIDLGVDLYKDTAFSNQDYANDLAQRIVSEIKLCRLRDFFPWKVYVYYKCREGKLDMTPSVFVQPPCGMSNLEYIAKRGHAEFMKALEMDNQQDICVRLAADQKIRISPAEGVTDFLCRDIYPLLSRMLDAAISHYNLTVHFGREETDKWGNELKVECLTIGTR